MIASELIVTILILAVAQTSAHARPLQDGGRYREDPLSRSRPVDPNSVIAPDPKPDEWYAEHIANNLSTLDRLADELVETVDGNANDATIVRQRARRIAKVSRATWTYVQLGRARGELPAKPVSHPEGHSNAAQQARVLRSLVTSVIDTLRGESSKHHLDVVERKRVLDDLRGINELALGL